MLLLGLYLWGLGFLCMVVMCICQVLHIDLTLLSVPAELLVCM